VVKTPLSGSPEKMIGLGETQAFIRVFIQNIPQRQPWQQIEHIEVLPKGEIQAIGQACGNGWRKVFNVYAKWLFAMRYIKEFEKFVPFDSCQSWQDYRDQKLLQTDSNTSLLFSRPSEINCDSSKLNIIMGRTYAKSCSLTFTWLDHEFAYQRDRQIIVCPYFDYRQLSNSKIIRLCEYIEQLGFLDRLADATW
jgi:hypothetical protein